MGAKSELFTADTIVREKPAAKWKKSARKEDG
jgi:hypothetical protein